MSDLIKKINKKAPYLRITLLVPLNVMFTCFASGGKGKGRGGGAFTLLRLSIVYVKFDMFKVLRFLNAGKCNTKARQYLWDTHIFTLFIIRLNLYTKQTKTQKHESK